MRPKNSLISHLLWISQEQEEKAKKKEKKTKKSPRTPRASANGDAHAENSPLPAISTPSIAGSGGGEDRLQLQSEEDAGQTVTHDAHIDAASDSGTGMCDGITGL